MDDCKHTKLVAYTAHPRIRAYQCRDCKKVAFGKSPDFYSVADLSAVIDRINTDREV